MTRAQREALRGHRGAVLWFTGLSGSGKSTLAHALERALIERGFSAYVLDGDNIRHGLSSDLGFSPRARHENMRRIGEVAKLFVDAGVIVLCAFVSPYRDDRARLRATDERRRLRRDPRPGLARAAGSATRRACTRRPSTARSPT